MRLQTYFKRKELNTTRPFHHRPFHYRPFHHSQKKIRLNFIHCYD